MEKEKVFDLDSNVYKNFFYRKTKKYLPIVAPPDSWTVDLMFLPKITKHPEKEPPKRV